MPHLFHLLQRVLLASVKDDDISIGQEAVQRDQLILLWLVGPVIISKCDSHFAGTLG